MKNIQYRFYSIARRILPSSVQESLGASEFFKPLRNQLLRPGGQSNIETGPIVWEDLQFIFRAPYRDFFRARERGVENTLCRLARSVLKPGDTAIDVGANYGFVTLVMAHSVTPGGKVFSFEINAAVAAILDDTLGLNELESTVHLVKTGAGAIVEKGLTTVDAVLAGYKSSPVKFLKVDTDGSDYEVLLGAREVLERDHPVVVVEMSDNQQKIYELLYSCGYAFFSDIHGHPLTVGEWPDNLVASTSAIVVPEKGAFVRPNGSGNLRLSIE